MQATAYENNLQLAQTGVSQPGSAAMARRIDHATRAVSELEFLAERIATLTDTEVIDIKGAFVGEISSLLYDCLQVRQRESRRRNSAESELWTRVYKTGLGFETCLNDLRDRGHTTSDLAFCLYTTGMRLNNATVVYSRKWYAEKRDTRRLDVCAGAMLKNLCKSLPATNIILYISEDEQSALPPWVVDEFLQKRLTDGELPEFPGNYHWGLNQYPLPAHSREAQRQLDVQESLGKDRDSVNDQEQPSDDIQTSKKQEISWTIEGAQEPVRTPAGRTAEVHKRRTGQAPHASEQEEDDLPLQYRRLTAHLQTGSVDFNRRLAVYLTQQVAMRSAMDKMINSSSMKQYTDMGPFATNMYPPPMNSRDDLGSRVDAMDTDWNIWDNSMASSREKQPSSNFQPPIVEEQQPWYEVTQSRPSPVIEKLVPVEGTMAGGTEVIILGSGFYDGLEVVFGDTESAMTTFWGEKCLHCVVPPALVPGTITVKFKHRHQVSEMQQHSQSGASTYKYVDDREVGMYRLALKTLGNEMQSPKAGLELTPHQSTAEVSRTTSSGSSAKETSPVMSNNFAMMVYLAGCLGAPAVQPAEIDQILEEVGRILVSLIDALAVLPLEDHTILSAILLWSIEHVWNHQDRADLHWNGIQVLIQCRPDFDIARPLTGIFTEMSLILTKQEHDSVKKASNYIAEVFTSALENTMVTGHVDQSVVSTVAPTPAGTVYSPWSETDAEPPPYMLSPTPLKQACLIYAAVNARS